MSNAPKPNPKNATTAVPVLYNRGGLAGVLHCCRQHTYYLQNDPDFPEPFYVGSTPLWLAAEVARYIEIKAARLRSTGALAPLEAEPRTTVDVSKVLNECRGVRRRPRAHAPVEA
jgi:hypothetical protein